MKIANSVGFYSLISLILICIPNLIEALQLQPSLLNNTYAALEGTGVVITCIDDKAPPNSLLVWTKGNREINVQHMKASLVSRSPPQLALFVTEISREDAGEYKCQSLNKATRRQIDNITLKFIVYKKITFTSPNEVSVLENDDARIECIIANDADIKSATFTWKSNKEQINTDDNRYKISDKNNYSELRILKVNRNDTRKYECEVYLVYELAFKIAEQAIQLTVEYKPEFAPNIPKYIWIPGKHRTQGNETVNITCIVNSTPNAIIEWRKGKNTIIRTAPEFVKEDKEKENLSTLVIKRPERRSPMEEIIYTCVASNKYGTSRHEFVLKEGSPPNIPKLVHFSYTDAKLVLVIEEGFTSPKLDTYRIDFHNGVDVKFEATERSKDLFNRRNETYSVSLPNGLRGEQSFKLSVHNPIGWSEPSQDNSYTIIISNAMNLVNNGLLLFLMIALLHIIH